MTFTDMDITFLGHSSFRIKTKTASIVTDPFDPKMVGIKYNGVEGDIVTVSHHHPDHDKSELVKGTKQIIDGPGEYEISEVSVWGYNTYHDDKNGEERGRNTIYLIEADGLTLCHLGDLGHTLSESLVEDLGTVDVLFVPVGGEVTLGSEEAVKVVQEIEPSIVIPMHYQEPGLSKEHFAKLEPVEEFLKKVELTVETLPKLTIKREDVSGEDQKVVVLERK